MESYPTLFRKQLDLLLSPSLCEQRIQSHLSHSSLGNWLDLTRPTLELTPPSSITFVWVPLGCLLLSKFILTSFARTPPGVVGTVSVLVAPLPLNQVSFWLICFLKVFCWSLSAFVLYSTLFPSTWLVKSVLYLMITLLSTVLRKEDTCPLLFIFLNRTFATRGCYLLKVL